MCSSMCTVYKGPDQAEVETVLTDKDGKKIGGTLDHDEVQTFVLARYLSSCEAVSRIMGACLQKVSHNIVRLALHPQVCGGAGGGGTSKRFAQHNTDSLL